jgi:hypothetical protein
LLLLLLLFCFVLFCFVALRFVLFVDCRVTLSNAATLVC